MSNNDNLPSHKHLLNLSELQKSAISDSKALSIQNKDLSEETADIEVTPEFEAILNAIHTGNACMFITGKAGTDKSTLINSALRSWLKAKREAKGLSLRDVGQLTGRHHSVIGKMEQDRRKIDIL